MSLPGMRVYSYFLPLKCETKNLNSKTNIFKLRKYYPAFILGWRKGFKTLIYEMKIKICYGKIIRI